jgi:hypothetical protein
MANNNKTSPFIRNVYGSNPYDGQYLDPQDQIMLSEDKQVFTGADYQAYVGTRRVGNLESVTCSISVEVVGNYTMGRRDAVVYTTGKRVIVGSIVFSQYDKHAFLEEVWNVSALGIKRQSDFWSFDQNTVGAVARAQIFENASSANNTGFIRSDYQVQQQTQGQIAWIAALRGLSPEAFDAQLRDQLLRTVRIVGSQKVRYADQIQPFDLSLIGVNGAGRASRCAIFGMRITQETMGISSTDLSNAVGMSYVALAVDPLQPITADGNYVYLPPSR